MTGRTEERLRDATVALGEAIRPADIPELRLSSDLARSGRTRWRSGWPRRGVRWLIPLTAAAAMLALIGVLAVGRFGPATSRPSAPPTRPVSPFASVPPSAAVRGLPPFLVLAVAGRCSVWATATGRLVARIPPPARGLALEGVAAAPGGRVFYLAAEDFAWQRARAMVEFFRIVLNAAGRPGPAQRLPGAPLSVPPDISSSGLMTFPIAVSPDGTELAYPSDNQYYPDDYAASHPATITVQTVATGRRRSWSVWPATDTVITNLSWAVGGKLGFTATIGDATVANGRVIRHRTSDVQAFMILDTEAGGVNLVGASRLISYVQVPSNSYVGSTQQGAPSGLISADGRSVDELLHAAGSPARLVAISLATGQVTRVLLSGTRAADAEPLGIEGDSLLIQLDLSSLPRGKTYYLRGHYARIDLRTGRVTVLPFGVYYSTLVPLPPVQPGW